MTSAVLLAADLPPGQPWVSPDDLSAITPLWQEASEATLIPIVAQVYNDAAGALHASLVDAAESGVPAITSLASEQYLAAARNTFEQVGADLWETARSELLDGFQKGESIPELRDRLRQSAGLTNRRATYVARTQVLDASNAGSYDTAQASGLDLVKGWEATPDMRTRETHLMAGSTYSGPGMIPLADRFMVGGWPAERPHDPELPPEERYSCFPAGTLVQASRLERGYRRWHQGELVEISTAEGKQLSGTPNHPVLTRRGWVALGLIAEGDELVDYRPEPNSTSRHDVDAEPALIEEVFDALAVVGELVRVPGHRVDFHGDRPQGNVDVVRADRQLRDRPLAAYLESVEDLPFPLADVRTALLPSGGGQSQRGLAPLGSSDCIMGSGGEGEPLVNAGLGHSDVHALAPIARLDAMGEQPSSQGGPAGSDLDCQSLLGLTGQVALDKVISVRRVEAWAGHVYNLQTAAGTYVANGIIVHNCRCTTVYAMRPVVIDRRQAHLDDLAAQHQAKLDAIRARYERRLAAIEARHQANIAAIRVTATTPSVSVEQAIVTSETRLAQAVAAHDARVARLTADYEFRQAKLTSEYDYRVAQARGESTPPTLPAAPQPAGPPPAPMSATEFEQHAQSAASGSDVIELTEIRSVDEQIRKALQDYAAGGSYRANEQLRLTGGDLERIKDGYARSVIEGLDQAFEGAGLEREAILVRGLPDLSMLGGRQPSVGMEWLDQGFVSTSASARAAAMFTGEQFDITGGVEMRILVPRGTPAISKGDLLVYDNEVVLDRGLRYRIVQDRGEDSGGVRQLDVEIVPRQPPAVAPAPTPQPIGPLGAVATKPVEVPVRASLMQATTIPEVRAAFIQEWKNAVATEPGAIRGSARFLTTGDVQTAREHAEGLLRAIERFPMVRIDVSHGPMDPHWAETAGRVISFSDEFARGRDDYLLSLRLAGIPDPDGVAWTAMSRSSPQGIALHEFGHALAFSVARDAAGVYDYAAYLRLIHELEDVIKNLATERGIPDLHLARRDMIQREVGGYAATSTQELISEAFADVMVNGDAASELSKRIVAMLIRRYEAQNGPMVGPPLTGLPKLPAGPPRVVRARPGSTIGDVELGPTQFQQALGEAPMTIRLPAGDFVERPYLGPDSAIVMRGQHLPADFKSDLVDIRRGRFELRPGLTAEESQALDRYALTRVADPINNGLRRGETSGFGTARIADQIVDLDRELADLDSAIAAGSLSRDTMLYRGALMRPADMGRLQLGAVTSESGFLSTTTDSLNAFGIINWRARTAPAGRSRVLFQILAPKGMNAAAAHIEEAEVLLARGLRFRVVEITRPTRQGGTRIVTLESLTQRIPLAVADDGLDLMTVAQLKALAKARGLATLPARKPQLIQALRAQVTADQNLANAIAEAVDLMERAIASGNAARARTALADAIKLLQESPGAELALRAANLAPTGARTVIARLRKLAEQRGLTLPTGRQLSALKAARAKAVRAEKARLAAIKKQTAALNRGEFEHLVADTEPGRFTTPDGGTWLVESFATEQDARERALYAVLHQLVTGDKGAPPPTFVIGRGAPGLKGWQVAYPDMATPLPGVGTTDWLAVPLARLQALTPARIKALVRKAGLPDDLAEKLIAARADTITKTKLMARKFPSRLAPPLNDLKALDRLSANEKAKFIDGPYGQGGLRVRLTSFHVDPNATHPYDTPIQFEGDIFLRGRKVGTFERDYGFDANGELFAHHAYLELDRSVQGSGFAEQFNANLIDWYRRSGIKRIELSANIDVGGYAWARAGYEFANQASADTIRGALERLIRGLSGGNVWQFKGWDKMAADEIDAQIRAAQALLARVRAHPRFDDPLHPSAYEFSQVGRHAGQGKDDVWIGKAAMLGTYWSAVLYL